jgi:hypothetical protein
VAVFSDHTDIIARLEYPASLNIDHSSATLKWRHQSWNVLLFLCTLASRTIDEQDECHLENSSLSSADSSTKDQRERVFE